MPAGPELIGVGARLVLEPGGLRNALGDREGPADGDVPEPADGPAARAGAVAWLPAVVCGWV